MALGVAVGAAVIAAVGGGALLTEDRHLARSLDEIPAERRSVQIAHFGILVSGETYRGVDARVAPHLAALGLGDPIRVVQYKLLRIGGRRVVLGGIQNLDRWVRVESGRLPRTCSPTVCEVLVVRGHGRLGSGGEPRLVEVGRGRLTSPLPFGWLGTTGGETSETLGRRESPPLALAAGVTPVSQLPALSSIYRSYVWVVPVTGSSVRPWSVDSLDDEVEQARSSLRAVTTSFDVAAPLPQLRAGADTGRVAAHRLLLVGGQAAALLLAFAMFAAATMRRDVDAAWRRLTWLGARRWQLVTLTLAETGILVFLAAAIGWVAGSIVTALVAARANAPAGEIVGHSVASGRGVAGTLALAALTTALLFIALRIRELPIGGRELSAIDVAALGAALAVVLAVGRGDADATRLTAGSTGTFLLLLPGLVLFAAAIASARLLAPALRALERVVRSRTVSLRVAALSVARRPGYALTATAFLVVSLALAFFAVIYRATLTEGQDDQVDYAFPYDFLIREDLSSDRLALPLQAAPLSRYSAIQGAARALPVIRQRGTVSGIARSQQVTVLALPADVVTSIDGWRDDFSSRSLAGIAGAIRPGDVRLQGDRLPRDATSLAVPVVVLGDDVVLSASIRTPDGRFITVDLGRTRGTTPATLRAPLPAAARGGLLLGVTLRRTLGVEGHAQGNVPTLRGVLTLRPLRAGRRDGAESVVSRYEDWTGTGGVEALHGDGHVQLNFFVSSSADARFRLRQPVDAKPISAIVSDDLAATVASDRVLPVRLPAGQVAVHVAATAARFPTIAGSFVLVDEAALSTALNTVEPGAARVNEVWLDARSSGDSAEVAASLQKRPFNVLAVAERAEFEHDLHTQPLAVGTLAILTGVAVVSFFLALLGLGLLVAADLRDERGELFDLEAQGATPSALRRHVALRVALVAAPALIGAVGVSVVLGALVVDFVAVTAAAQAPEPPLRLALSWEVVAALVVAYVALASVGVAAVLRLAFRGPTPRPEST